MAESRTSPTVSPLAAADHTPPPEESRAPVLLVTMPALNEERTVGDVVRSVPREIPGIARVEVVVIDDGSTDRTVELARAAGAEVISHGRQRGVGSAFQTALAHGLTCGADLIVGIDSDGQFNPADIPRLVEPVLRGEADFATASRFADPDLTPRMPALKRWGNRMMSRLISRLTRQTFYDVSCGFRCYNRRAALNLHLMGRFTYTQEVFLNLAFKHLRLVEVPLRIRGEREHGRSRVASNLWHYAVNTSRIIFRCYRDYHPLRFFGMLALVLWVPAVALGVFFLMHYLLYGKFTGQLWAGFTSAALFAFGLMSLHIGLIGDMLTRHRIYLEELLYHSRVRNIDDEGAAGRNEGRRPAGE